MLEWNKQPCQLIPYIVMLHMYVIQGCYVGKLSFHVIALVFATGLVSQL